MKIHSIFLVAIACLIPLTAFAAGPGSASETVVEGIAWAGPSPAAAAFLAPALLPALPRMAPELALASFHNHAKQQMGQVPSYSAATRISAELPDSSQRGEFELMRRYSTPNTLQFMPVRFTGDNFVKHNVINRLLTQEVEHTERQEAASTAISEQNYKFSHKGDGEIDGRSAHIYQVKPRAKNPGLFKGRVYLDVTTGALLRAEGTLVKPPSFFIKKIEFVTDYADFGGFTLPVHVHSIASTRLVGRVVVDITTSDYNFTPTATTIAAR